MTIDHTPNRDNIYNIVTKHFGIDIANKLKNFILDEDYDTETIEDEINENDDPNDIEFIKVIDTDSKQKERLFLKKFSLLFL